MTTAQRSAHPSPQGEPGGVDFRENLIELIPFLRAFARTLCGHRDEADDLCQEALAKAWQGRASFEPGTNLKAWLFMILRNQFYSDKRRAWRQRPWDDASAEKTLITHGAQESAVTLSEITRALSLLPTVQREALILVGPGGFAYEEAAKICGCALGTIKSRVARAREALVRVRDGAASQPAGRVPPSGEALGQISAQLDVLVNAKSG